MKKWKIVIPAILVIPVLLVAASGVRTNPDIEGEVKWDSPKTRTLFYRACADCHSHETKWPWYSYVAPVSWKIIHHVNEGREEFNISAVDLGEGEEAAEEVREGKMPLSDYVRFHPEAALTDEETEALITGLIATFGDTENSESHDHDRH